MKKFYVVFLMIAGCISSAKADHITGGEMFYTSSPGATGFINYNVTLKLFMRCNSGRQFNNPAIVSIFNRSTNARITDVSVPLFNQQTIQIADAGPCVTNPPRVCYVIGTYQFTIALGQSIEGYTLAAQVNFRISGINNLIPNYSNIGATYTSEIPGTRQVANVPLNQSARFVGSDLVIVCTNNRFAYSFAASDADGDQLRYSFCSAFVSGSVSVGNNSVPPPNPPYSSVPYGALYGGSNPLGSQVSIDPNTGLITGIAPPTGVYVVTVCVEEIRNGIVIATQRKDLQINIAACDIAASVLEPEYQLCRDTKSITISNLSNSPLIKTQDWQFKSSDGTTIYNSTDAIAAYTFADTGIYTIRLIINRGQACSDSTMTLVRVYPGFIPAFTSAGICFTKPSIFKDATTTISGTVNSWKWDFGETTASDDTSILPNPAYTYPEMGTKLVQLTATNTKGCRDTVTKVIQIVDKPPLNLAFNDTLICVSDKVTLMAGGSGTYNWSPAVNITNSNTVSPTVSPTNTTRYYVDLNDQGCLNRDSVLVRVTDHVTLSAMTDTTICQGDSIQLRVTSDGFQYSWTPAVQLADANVANPIATTNAVTTYEVTAFIGSCVATDQVKVTTVPYPLVNAGTDTTLCFNSFGQLHGSTNGNTFKWFPAAFLSNSNILNPTANPLKTTTYTLSASDTKGCPKPATDSVQVIVLPDINAFAGNDTSAVTNQELHLNATGGSHYFWTPSIGLSSTSIANPVARYNEPSEGLEYLVYVSNEAGCVDSASINIKVFGTPPVIFVPTAFTPNSDGKNDVLRAISAGIKKIEYFSIYNRWGRLVFTTSEERKGWDGTIGGSPQGTGTFVWMAKAVDYLGTPYFQKGTVTLIR